MNRLFIFTSLLFPLFVLWGCSSDQDNRSDIIPNPEKGIWQNSEDKKVQFELIDQISFEEPGETLISGINYLSLGPDGNLYFFDRQQNTLNSITQNGKIRWSTGQAGRGPGDFENVSDLTVIDDLVLVSNIQGTRLDLFDLDGNFEHSVQLADDILFAKIIGKNRNGEVLISSMLRGKLGVNVHSININPELTGSKTSFSISQGPKLDVKVGVGLHAGLTIRDGKIYSGNTSSYEIGIYSLTGKLLQKITRDFDKMVRPGIIKNENFSALRTFGELSNPYFFTDGSFITISIWPENIDDPDEYLDKVQKNTAPDVIRANSLDYFSKEGQLLYSIEYTGFYPEIGNLQFIDKNDILYTLKGLTINKYKFIK